MVQVENVFMFVFVLKPYTAYTIQYTLNTYTLDITQVPTIYLIPCTEYLKFPSTGRNYRFWTIVTSFKSASDKECDFFFSSVFREVFIVYKRKQCSSGVCFIDIVDCFSQGHVTSIQRQRNLT